MKRELAQFDRTATAILQEKPLWLRPVMQLVSFVGHPVLITALAFGISIISYSQGGLRQSYTLLLCCIAALSSSVLKLALRRARPDTIYARNMWPKTNSFPSGHAFTMAVMAGIAAYYANLRLIEPWGTVAVVALVGSVIVVGYSRIYLGAHYVFDVLAGWGLGLFALSLLLTFAGAGD